MILLKSWYICLHLMFNGKVVIEAKKYTQVLNMQMHALPH